jgi:hypothetical protein
MTPPKTVRVRVCVVVDDRGRYNACGWNGADDEMLRITTQDGFDPHDIPIRCEHVRFIEADVPLPEPEGETIEGEVTS